MRTYPHRNRGRAWSWAARHGGLGAVRVPANQRLQPTAAGATMSRRGSGSGAARQDHPEILQQVFANIRNSPLPAVPVPKHL